jgi:TfoX/Sxy family transcriptional regulator of competence genes
MAGPKSQSGGYADKLALYEKLVATVHGLERKGATMPYTSMNGNMYSLLTKDGTLTLRLPEGERERFLAKYKSKLTEQYGAVMKEYVDVPDALLARTSQLEPWFAASHAYAKTLKPKPTKRTAPASASPSRRPAKRRPRS